MSHAHRYTGHAERALAPQDLTRPLHEALAAADAALAGTSTAVLRDAMANAALAVLVSEARQLIERLQERKVMIDHHSRS